MSNINVNYNYYSSPYPNSQNQGQNNPFANQPQMPYEFTGGFGGGNQGYDSFMPPYMQNWMNGLDNIMGYQPTFPKAGGNTYNYNYYGGPGPGQNQNGPTWQGGPSWNGAPVNTSYNSQPYNNGNQTYTFAPTWDATSGFGVTDAQHTQAWTTDTSLKDMISGTGIAQKGWQAMTDTLKTAFGTKEDITVEDLKQGLATGKFTGDAAKAATLLLTNKDLLNQLDTAGGGTKDGKFNISDFEAMAKIGGNQTYAEGQQSKFDKEKGYQDSANYEKAWKNDPDLKDMIAENGRDIKKEGYEALKKDENWKLIDKDGDGTITADELSKAITEGKLSPEAMKAAKLLSTNKDLLNELDGDKDGKISYNALQEKINRGSNSYNGESHSKWDAEKGYQDARDYDKAWKKDAGLKYLQSDDGSTLNDKGWAAIKDNYAKIDQNGDGVISAEDLEAALKNDQLPEDAKRAAVLLMTNKDLLNQMDTANGGKGDGRFSPSDIDKMRDRAKGSTYSKGNASKWDNEKKEWVVAPDGKRAWVDDVTLNDMKTPDGKDIKKAGYKALLDNYDSIKNKDGNITPESLQDAINSGKLSGDALKAAKLLMNSREKLKDLDNAHGGNPDGTINKSDLQKYYDGLK